MVAPAVLVVPVVAAGALGDVVLVRSAILAVAEGVLVPLLVAEDTDEGGLRVGFAVMRLAVDRCGRA